MLRASKWERSFSLISLQQSTSEDSVLMGLTKISKVSIIQTCHLSTSNRKDWVCPTIIAVTTQHEGRGKTIVPPCSHRPRPKQVSIRSLRSSWVWQQDALHEQISRSSAYTELLRWTVGFDLECSSSHLLVPCDGEGLTAVERICWKLPARDRLQDSHGKVEGRGQASIDRNFCQESFLVVEHQFTNIARKVLPTQVNAEQPCVEPKALQRSTQAKQIERRCSRASRRASGEMQACSAQPEMLGKKSFLCLFFKVLVANHVASKWFG